MPLALAAAVATIDVPSTLKCTTELGSAVPVNAALDEILSVDELPVSVTSFSVTVGDMPPKLNESEAEPVLPAKSVSLATIVCGPLVRPVGEYDQAPLASAVAVAASALPSSVKCTTAL